MRTRTRPPLRLPPPGLVHQSLNASVAQTTGQYHPEVRWTRIARES